MSQIKDCTYVMALCLEFPATQHVVKVTAAVCTDTALLSARLWVIPKSWPNSLFPIQALYLDLKFRKKEGK